MSEGVEVTMTVNGRVVRARVEPGISLLMFLRRHLNLTGTKEGCAMGECGACTVLVDGETVASCLMLAAQADGRAIRTVEGLMSEGQLHPVQRGFLEAGGVQCGFCTPGMVMAAVGLLERNRRPTTEEIQVGISGNLCRCTGYAKIVKAVQRAAEIIDEQDQKPQVARPTP